MVYLWIKIGFDYTLIMKSLVDLSNLKWSKVWFEESTCPNFLSKAFTFWSSSGGTQENGNIVALELFFLVYQVFVCLERTSNSRQTTKKSKQNQTLPGPTTNGFKKKK